MLNLSLCKIVVLPALSSPNIRIFVFFELPKLENISVILVKKLPIVLFEFVFWIIKGLLSDLVDPTQGYI